MELFAAEPLVRQPVTMTVDRQGRVWVIQYLQYPEPAGLKKVRGDRYDRIRYDRTPEPPPRGPRGADCVTILSDTDGDGRADTARDFVEGLNLASGLALGHGGVWVLQSPYLLFYPDADEDDVPDGDPEVRLVGFGLDDAHSVANSLQWGPDGWLYGVHGSTVNANVRGIKFQQGIWRYDPASDRFELFAEGGGNTYGLDFDARGQAIAGTNWGLPGLHQRQGSYHVKNFGKHGALHNPYAFGYFEHMTHHGTSIGKLSVGGVFYRAQGWPERFHGQYITANPLNHAVYSIEVRPQGSTFATYFREPVLWSDDPWFQPVDLALAPDGSLLVADWYDGNINYQVTYRNRDNFDPERGRIYRITADSDAGPPRPVDVQAMTNHELTAQLQHPNGWHVRAARLTLAERRPVEFATELFERALTSDDEHKALQALWALHVVGGLSDERAVACLASRHADVRAWTIRLLGDNGSLAIELSDRLVSLAGTDPSIEVRAQLACTARRLDSQTGLAIVAELWQHDEDAGDDHLPLLLWWAVESCVGQDREAIFLRLADPQVWQRTLLAETILPRLARRFAAEGRPAGFEAGARLLRLAPRPDDVERIVAAMDTQLQGLSSQTMPVELEQPLAKLWQQGDPSPRLVAFALRMGSEAAWALASRRILAADAPAAERVALVAAMAETGRAAAVEPLLQTLREATVESVRSSTLAALPRFDDASIPQTILEIYPDLSPTLQADARRALCHRVAWGRSLVAAVSGGIVAAADVTYDELRQLLQHQDAELTSRVERQWGRIRLATPQEKQQQMQELASLLAAAPGDAARGKPLFTQHCGTCHRLHGEGNRIGPELTPYPRHDRSYLILHTVDPSAVIRPEYQAVTAVMADGRVVTGLIAETTPQTMTLLDANNQRTILDRTQIEELQDLPQSLMPEKLFAPLSPNEIQDLFAYVQSQPSPRPPAKTSADAGAAAP